MENKGFDEEKEFIDISIVWEFFKERKEGKWENLKYNICPLNIFRKDKKKKKEKRKGHIKSNINDIFYPQNT